jgi:hypothetical protein
MTDPRDNLPITREERIKDEYYGMEKYAPNDEIDWFITATEITCRHARDLKRLKNERGEKDA